MAYKGETSGYSRKEIEFNLWSVFGLLVLGLVARFCSRKILKTRYYLMHDDEHLWEIDVFREGLEGLVLVEMEASDEGFLDELVLPVWIGDDVSSDLRYLNAVLAVKGLPAE